MKTTVVHQNLSQLGKHISLLHRLKRVAAGREEKQRRHVAGGVLFEDDPHWADDTPKGLRLPNNQAEAGCSKRSHVLEDLHQGRDTPDRLQSVEELEDVG